MTERIFDKIQHPFMTKPLSKLGIEGNYLNVMRNFYKNPIATSYLVVKK